MFFKVVIPYRTTQKIYCSNEVLLLEVVIISTKKENIGGLGNLP